MSFLYLWSQYLPADYRDVYAHLGKPPDHQINFMDFAHLMHTLMYDYPFVPFAKRRLDALGHSIPFPMVWSPNTAIIEKHGQNGLTGLLKWVRQTANARSSRKNTIDVQVVTQEIEECYNRHHICSGLLFLFPHYTQYGHWNPRIQSRFNVLVCVWLFKRWYAQLLTLRWRKEPSWGVLPIFALSSAHLCAGSLGKFIGTTCYVHRLPRICAFMILRRIYRNAKAFSRVSVSHLANDKFLAHTVGAVKRNPDEVNIRLTYVGDYPIWIYRKWNSWVVDAIHPLSSRCSCLTTAPYHCPPPGLRKMFDKPDVKTLERIFIEDLKLEMEDVEAFTHRFNEDPQAYLSWLVMMQRMSGGEREA